MKKVVILIFSICFYFVTYGQVKPEQLKANWIFIIAENVKFENDDKIDTLKIAVYGNKSPVFDYLKSLSEEKKINNKPVYAENISRINQLDGFNIVYVDESKNDFIEAIYLKIKGSGTLLITYQSKDQEHIMINLLLKGVGEQFQIHSLNLYDEKIIATDKLLALGGTKIDLQGLFEKKVAELDKKEIELREKESLLNTKELQLAEAKTEIDKQKTENDEKTRLIKLKEDELKREQDKAQKLLEEIARQEQILKNNQVKLAQQNKELQEKQNLIKEQTSELDFKKIEIETKQLELTEQQKRIDEQKATLDVQDTQIKLQQKVIIGAIIFILIFIFLSVVIWFSYRKNKRLNAQLKQKNQEVQQQKDELVQQAIQLEEFNKELAKLSLVASKTDNSVIIMDKESNFEWVNSGFTRLYGYTHQLLLNEKGKSLIEISDNTEYKKSLVNSCISTKKTVVYQSKNTTRTGEKIWVQTSLTPVLDDNDEIIKLIAIESDISKIKEQEEEIKQKNEELQMQKTELQAQKDLLEEVNNHVRDSINYALTIQKAFLPPIKLIEKHFENFLIYLPRDIVSGDFYWFSNPEPNKFFIATVDCTGHGVPGAFMSLIASRMLDEIVTIEQTYNPKDILEKLNKAIINALNQETTANRDGMDLALVKIEKLNQTNQITFAGAKRPLVYYQKNSEKLQFLKGNRRSIGGLQSMHTSYNYEQEEITLKNNDIIYISTDGMIDQNDKLRRRFGSTKFYEIIEKNKDLSLNDQKLNLLEEFNTFKNDEYQRDDITVWAIKL